MARSGIFTRVENGQYVVVEHRLGDSNVSGHGSHPGLSPSLSLVFFLLFSRALLHSRACTMITRCPLLLLGHERTKDTRTRRRVEHG
jgi:hypothetical protein